MNELIRKAMCVLCAAFAAAALSASRARAEDPPPPAKELPQFKDGRLISKNKVSTTYYLKPVNRAQLQAIAQSILAQHGIAAGQDYVMERDDTTHTLTITASPEVLELILRVISYLEEDEPQIRVSVRIVETSTNSDFQSGLDITFDRKTAKDTFFRGFSVNFSPKDYLESLSKTTTSVPFQGASTAFGTVDASGNVISQKEYDRVGAVYASIRALSAYQLANILAQPDIMVSNGQTAKVTTGGRYPYQSATLSAGTVSVSTSFLQVGISLTVTPFLVGEDKVHLTVTASVENVQGYVEGAQGVKNPYTVKRDIETKVVLEDGAELVMGGLFTKENTVIEKGIPILSEIPIIGLLFKSYWKTMIKKELLFFIKPKIVKTGSKLFFPGK